MNPAQEARHHHHHHHLLLRKTLSTNRTLLAVLARAATLGLPNWYLAAGALSQTIWNAVTSRPPGTGIRDYDLVYFDASDLSWEAEDAVIRRARAVFADVDVGDGDGDGDGRRRRRRTRAVEVEVRNQARVHLWYEQRFGVPGPLRYESVEAAIDSWISTSAMIGVRVVYDDGGGGDVDVDVDVDVCGGGGGGGGEGECEGEGGGGRWEVYAPRGLSDFFNLVVRPNPGLGTREAYEAKTRRWVGIWGELTVVPWPEDAEGEREEKG